jgi:hypothetical protein
MKAGSRASQPREPGQVREEAALSGRRRRRGVTWPEPALQEGARSLQSTVGARPFMMIRPYPPHNKVSCLTCRSTENIDRRPLPTSSAKIT